MEQINTPTDTASSGEVEIQSTEAYSVDWGNPPIHHTGLGVADAIEEMAISKSPSGGRGEFGGVLTVADESPFVKLDEPAGDPSFDATYAGRFDAHMGNLPLKDEPTSSAAAADEASPEKIDLELSTTRLPDFIDFELDANRPPVFVDLPPTWTSGDPVQKPEQLPELVSASRVQMHKAPQAEQALDAILLGSEEAKQRMELHIDPDAPIPDSVIEALETMPGQEITVKRKRSPVLDMAAIMIATGAGQLPFPNVTQPTLKPGQRYWTERELAAFDKQNEASAEALRLAEEKRQRRMQRNLRNVK